MNKPVIGITGATGYVGAALAEYLAHNGFPIVSLTRKNTPGFNHRHYDLEKPVPQGLLEGTDILVHCAFVTSDHNKTAGNINYEATKQLLLEARRSGVRKTIFFSTVSAHAEALSEYGKSKLRTETLFSQHDVILQCGLVVGRGGLFGRMLRHALSLRIIPLIENGSQPFQVIAMHDVQKSVLTIIMNHYTGKFVLANDEQLTYRQFFTTVSKVYKRSLVFVPVSPALIKLLATIAPKLKINPPFNREQIYGLQGLTIFDPSESLARLDLIPLTLEEMLLQLKRASL